MYDRHVFLSEKRIVVFLNHECGKGWKVSPAKEERYLF